MLFRSLYRSIYRVSTLQIKSTLPTIIKLVILCVLHKRPHCIPPGRPYTAAPPPLFHSQSCIYIHSTITEHETHPNAPSFGPPIESNAASNLYQNCLVQESYTPTISFNASKPLPGCIAILQRLPSFDLDSKYIYTVPCQKST